MPRVAGLSSKKMQDAHCAESAQKFSGNFFFWVREVAIFILFLNQRRKALARGFLHRLSIVATGVFLLQLITAWWCFKLWKKHCVNIYIYIAKLDWNFLYRPSERLMSSCHNGGAQLRASLNSSEPIIRNARWGFTQREIDPEFGSFESKSDIVYTIFRLNLNRTQFRLVQNQSENSKYNLISVWFNKISKIFLCVWILGLII